MSRSRKKHPFWAVTTCSSAKQDKRLAARGVRRSVNAAIHAAADFEDFSPPHRLECAWNNTYSWSRDGRQRYHDAPRRETVFNHWSSWAYLMWNCPDFEKYYAEEVRNFERMMRK